MKIAFILPSLAAKAPIFITKCLSDYFIEQGNKVEVFYFDEIYGTEFNCNTTLIKMSTPIDFDSFDIIHSHMMRPDRYIAKFSGQIKKARTVSTVHCNIDDDLKWSYGKIVSAVYSKKWLNWLKHFDTTVQINDYLMELYSKRLEHNHLIYNGVSISKYEDDYTEIVEKIQEFKKLGLVVLCSYSGIVERKGLHQILEVLKIRKDLSYICIGDGNQKKRLMKLAGKSGLDRRVYFSSFKKNPYNIMKYADVFMIPSYSEGFSLALLEAGSIGTSIVCSNISAFNMPFSTTEVSFFKLNDIHSLSLAINEALSKKELKKNALKNKIEIEFSHKRMQEKYEALYEKLIGNI